MNEAQAINAILRDRYARSLCVPRYTPRHWWECDVFEVTEAGLFREYEVKLTLADFKADAQKRNVKEGWGEMQILEGDYFTPRWCEYPCETKHGLLASHSHRGPSRFWYVTPEGLLKPDILPVWAGLIEIEYEEQRTLTGILCQPWMREREVVKAPQLHRTPLDEKIRSHARGVCYYRMHTLLQRGAKVEPLADLTKEAA